jgi:hypothetical protein
VDDLLQEASPADPWRETFANTIDQDRRRAGQRVADQRQRLRDLDARIASQLDATLQALSQEQNQAQHATAHAHAKTAALEERQKLLDDRQTQLEARQAELDKLQSKLSEEKAAAPQQVKDAKRREAELSAAQQATAAELANLTAQREALREQENSLKLKEQSLAALEQQTKRQRQTIAKQLRAQKSAPAAEANHEQFTQHTAELQQLRRESQQQIDSLREYIAQASKGIANANEGEAQSLRQQLADLQAKLAEAKIGADEAQTRYQQQLAARQSDGSTPHAAAELAKLREENKQLEAWLAEAEQRAKSAGSGGGQEMDDLRRRFEMAVQDVRELKTKNVELGEQLAKAQKSPAAVSAGAVSGGGWESLKQKLLADLDSDFDENNADQKADKLTVQGAIKITDEVVAEKERELEELRRLLDCQSQQIGEVAVGAAAVTQMLDTDELVRQEREALKRLQDQLRDQLRQAELDISVERARLAREKSELEEKLRTFEAEKASLAPDAGDAPGDAGKKPKGRKWLARLGLGEGNDG